MTSNFNKCGQLLDESTYSDTVTLCHRPFKYPDDTALVDYLQDVNDPTSPLGLTAAFLTLKFVRQRAVSVGKCEARLRSGLSLYTVCQKKKKWEVVFHVFYIYKQAK